jgi:hypothetical protein
VAEIALGLAVVACIVLVPMLILAAHRRRYRWLARRAARRRADGRRGLLARWALRILVRMAGGYPDAKNDAAMHALRSLGDQNENEAGWQKWLDHPTDRGWAALTMRLDRPAQGGRRVWRSSAPSAQSLKRLFTEAAAPSRDARARERLGVFCARHGLAPENSAERAVFFLLTSQLEAYRAEDPDGALVAVAYQAAGEAMRAAVREAALAAGDLDLLRVLAQRPQLDAEQTGDQTGRLAWELAGRQEWARLWRLAMDATLEQALAVAPLLAGWQPPGEPGRRLLRLLQDAEPGVVTAARATLRAAPPAGLPALPVVTSVSFAPDLSEVAVASHTGANGPDRLLDDQLEAAVEMFALPGGQRISSIVSDRWLARSVLHLGDVVVAADVRRCDPGEHMPSACRLVSYRGRSRKLVWRTSVFMFKGESWRLFKGGSWRLLSLQHVWGGGWRRWQLAPTQSGRGFVAVHPLGGGLLLGSGRRRVLIRTFPRLDGVVRYWAQVGTDPASGRIALTSDTELVVLDSALRVLASCHETEYPRFRETAPFFCGPDTLITADPHRLRLWRLNGGDSGAGTLEMVASQRPDHGGYGPPLVVLPSAGLVGCCCHGGASQMAWFDTATLAPAAAPPGMPDGRVDGVWASPGGEYLAVAVGGRVHVCEPWPRGAALLLTRPMAAMGPADLAAAADLERTDPNAAVRRAMGLLLACLEFRIGAEVALDDVAAPHAGGADDIGLRT